MKSYLQNLVVLSAVLLLAACGGGSGGQVDEVPVSPGNPTVTISGAAVKGTIVGGTITVTDANGAAVPIASGATTGADGSYTISISTTSTLATPLQVTVTGGTAICDRPAGCDGGVAYGGTYDLASDFSMSTVVRMLPAQATAHSGNISLGSNLATKIALGAGTTLSDAAVVSAQNSVKGIIKAFTGVDLGDADLNDIQPVDITDAQASATASLAQIAVSAFSAAALDLVDATDPDNDTLAEAVVNLAAAIAAGTDATTGNVSISASAVSVIARAVSNGMAKVATDLTTAGVTAGVLDIQAAGELAGQAADLAALAAAADPTATVTISPPAGTVDEALNQTRAFVDTLSRIINTSLQVTGAEGVGTDGAGDTELLANELDMVRLMSSAEATTAADNILFTICQVTNGDDYCESDNRVIGAETITVTEGDVTFTATNSAENVLTVTDVTSTAGSSTGTEVVITVGSLTHDIASGSVMLEDVVMTTSSEGMLKQTFSGSMMATYADATGGGLEMAGLMFDGTITGAASGSSFGLMIYLGDYDADGDGALSSITDDDVELSSVTGEYKAMISFSNSTDMLAISFYGEIGANVQGYAITANDDTVMGTVTRTIGEDRSVTDIDTMTDGTATLSLTVTGSLPPLDMYHDSTVQQVIGAQVQFPGTFSVGGVTTATLDEDGVVEYTDGSVQLLPGRVFAGSGGT